MTLVEIFLIILIHWIADFVLQAEKWALGKSKNWNDLLSHTISYSMSFFCTGILLSLLSLIPNILLVFYFTFITFIAHTITDYFTSRIVSKKFENKYYGSPIPNFGAFSIIGIDQVLHYFQLFSTYYLIKNI